MSTLNPVNTMHTISTTYLRYLRTLSPFQDQALQRAFRHETCKPGTLVKGPFLEAAPPFEEGRNIAQLVSAGILHPRFKALCSTALPYERQLYLHQDLAVAHIAQQQRNIIVATGTGSGKTETFLLAILNHLLQEEQQGTLHKPGVRALLLYPMNALANDQLRRLRHVLAHYPAITFGRYTGETEEQNNRAEERFRAQFPYEPLLSNELLSRQKMRTQPPHILLTNYAMLEYLLLRPEDCNFFDGETGQYWRFIVLDEAHIYDGASGIELAMLLRRLKERIVGSKPDLLRCIATSATLGQGSRDFPAAAKFAANLFGELFEWSAADPMRQDIIAAQRQTSAALGSIWGAGSSQLYQALQACLHELNPGISDRYELLSQLRASASSLVPSAVLAQACSAALSQWQALPASSTEHVMHTTNAFLYALLCGDQRIHHLHELVSQEPLLLEEAVEAIFPHESAASEKLIALVNLAVRARPEPDSLSLLPARYHAFVRALEGVFVCLNRVGHADQEPRLFLNRHETCPECQHTIVELATCMRCGAAYIVGSQLEAPSTQQLLLSQTLARNDEQLAMPPAYFLLGEYNGCIDEDETITTSGEVQTSETYGREIRYQLCLRCGVLSNSQRQGCQCGEGTLTLYHLKLKEGQEPHKCLSCGARSNNAIILRALTGQDAPVSVLATALYQQLPPSPDPSAADLPGEGRKLLVFSDSRQDAAFFAPYIKRTYNQMLHRHLILQALLSDPDGRCGELRLQDTVSRLHKAAERTGMFTQHQSRDERRHTVRTWLMQEFIAFDRTLSLEGVGLLQFRLVRPERWRPPTLLQAAPWNLSEEECWNLSALLLNTLRQQGVTTFLEGIDPRDEEFAPRNKTFHMRKEQADNRMGILSWLPTRGSNRRLELLERLLAYCAPDLSQQERKRFALEALDGLWKQFTTPGPIWRDHIISSSLPKCGIVYQLSHEFWEMVPLTGAQVVYRCNRCQAYSPLSLKALCTTLGCQGRLEACTLADLEREDNHYRKLYLTMPAIPLSAQEHTAQWTSDEAGKVQERFVRGELNLLSCSTTFELGVDVGELQAVLMRNVPPTTANYVQRAGRAGRRTDSAAFALTYAQRRSHDLTHYSNPRNIIAGHIDSPRITLENEKIIRRHMQAVLFAAFFRQLYEQEMRDFRGLGSFFQPGENQRPGTGLFIAYAQTQPAQVLAALRRIVPANMHEKMSLADWRWLRTAIGDGLLDLLERVDAEVIDDLTTYHNEEMAASAQGNYKLSERYQSIIRTIRNRPLLGFLASRNLLPKYGFPTDVVELKTDHLLDPTASRIQLERDLRIAIAEYAPRAEVVAANHIWVSGGLYKLPNRGWPAYQYSICPNCKRFIKRKVEESVPRICSCGGPLHLHGTFVIPEFGFVAAPGKIQRAGDKRPLRLYSSRVYFSEYATSQQEATTPTFERVEELSNEELEVSYYSSHLGRLALVNEGIDRRGFRICQHCGFAEITPAAPVAGKSRRTARPSSHINPRTNKPCEGLIETLRLGHEFLTDVVEIRFDGHLARTADTRLWRSLLYALMEGAAQALSIRRDDLDGTLYYPNNSNPPALMIFDNVPGGAGHVLRIAQALAAVFAAANERVSHNCCGAETSCYECLRNYHNQPYHDELKRGLVQSFLQHVQTLALL
ncbi:DEAD/DEAH box helicase [Ktedonosporobacter rubrisoli]|uniref:DEAD/DEAH box helicase n=1 Tax=Ktedonosporobacter rubrisoli TaxID=2509675 RepID=A0A4P6JZ02_KTERU|nr:DEAD/DEAH box helicase [Ktedonosporobacter rubrisoli]QBD80732.1 DEAD/DEAH box helicase [Ktedonosporobacter rubrisoli]